MKYKQNKSMHDYFEKQMSFLRTRVEHFFARVQQWRFLLSNALSEERFAAAMHMVLNLVHVNEMNAWPRYVEHPLPSKPTPPWQMADYDWGGDCDCKFNSLDELRNSYHEVKERTYDKQLQLAEHVTAFASAMPTRGKLPKKS